MNNEVIYSISVEDLRKVAREEFDVVLSADELKGISEKIGDRIPWYDIIAEVISEKILN
jgi:hypothetical protein